MGALQTVGRFFGVDSVPIIAGFTRSTRGARLPLCQRCGALVADEAQRTHADWHTATGS